MGIYPDPNGNIRFDAIFGPCGLRRTPYLNRGDVLRHEAMGVVEEVGSAVGNHMWVGDRVVVPFNISCEGCWMCSRGRFAQCETTQVRSEGKGASLFGYTSLYGSVPDGQAEYLRVPQAHFGPIVVRDGTPDEQFLFLSDILPTAWQAVRYADVPRGGVVAVLGLGPVGQLAVRIAALACAARGDHLVLSSRSREALEVDDKECLAAGSGTIDTVAGDIAHPCTAERIVGAGRAWQSDHRRRLPNAAGRLRQVCPTAFQRAAMGREHRAGTAGNAATPTSTQEQAHGRWAAPR
jgi:hypothetical protein